ncbi:MAG: hypothetical protein PHV99_01885 [Candidatus Pacebacteria bacterium]|nr:hypothetical protein [Candidatus Paceibacterota bacterium]
MTTHMKSLMNNIGYIFSIFERQLGLRQIYMRKFVPILLLTVLVVVLAPASVQADTSVWSTSISGGAFNGHEQIVEADAIASAMSSAGGNGGTFGHSAGRRSYFQFTATNGVYFTLDGVNIGSQMTIVHDQDWVGVANNICGNWDLFLGVPISAWDSGCSYVSTWMWDWNSKTLAVWKPSATPAGSLNVSPGSCVIQSGQSTCTSIASWSTTNVTSPALVDNNVNATLSTASASSGSGLTVWVAYPQTSFSLKDGSTVLSSPPAVTASCAPGSAWNGTLCFSPPGAPAVDGVCSTTDHYACDAGTAVNPRLQNGYWVWECYGLNGGADASCSEKAYAALDIFNLGTGSGTTQLPNTCTYIGHGLRFYNGVPGDSYRCVYGTFGYGSFTPDANSYLDSGYASSFYVNFDSDKYLLVSFMKKQLSGTITSNSCTIASGTSSCSMNVQWSSSGTAGTVTVQRAYSPFGVIATGTSGNQTFSFASPGTYHLDLYDDTKKVGAGGDFTALCPANAPWNGTLCLASPVPPTASLTIDGGSTETLTPGQANTKTWSSTNATSWSSTYSVSGTCSRAGTSGSWSANTASGFQNDIANNAFTGCTTIITYTATNAAGSASASISVTVAATASTPAGSLNVSPGSCVIQSGQSTCTSTASWSTTNVTSPALVDNNVNAMLSTASASSGLTVWVAYPQTSFSLKDGSTVLSSPPAVTASCAPGSAWNGTLCYTAPDSPATAWITATPTSVTSGGQARLDWGSSSNATSCTAGGPWSNQGTLSGNGLTNPLTSDTTFTFQCTGPGGTSQPAQASVTVLPATCADHSATNYGGPLPCTYASPSPASCITPWGSTLASGVSVTAFQSPSVVSPASCASIPRETRTCSNGSLSGSYANSNCVVLTPVLSISATPPRIQSGASTKVSWSATGGMTSCSVTKNGAAWQSGLSSPSSGVSASLTSQTIFTLTCDIGTPKSVTVNIVPLFKEF